MKGNQNTFGAVIIAAAHPSVFPVVLPRNRLETRRRDKEPAFIGELDGVVFGSRNGYTAWPAFMPVFNEHVAGLAAELVGFNLDGGMLQNR